MKYQKYYKTCLTVASLVLLQLPVLTGCTTPAPLAQSEAATQNINTQQHLIDEEKTRASGLDVQSTVAQNDYVYRKFYGVTAQGLFVVQDFYTENQQPFSSVFLLSSTAQVGTTLVVDVDAMAAWLKGTPVEGELTLFYSDGQVWLQGQYAQGKLTGHWQQWFDNGKKRLDAYYKDGLEHGTWMCWRKNGSRYLESSYEQGVLTGPWRQWYSDDSIDKEGQYAQGQKTGYWVSWHNSDGKANAGNYVEDERDGEWISWPRYADKTTGTIYPSAIEHYNRGRKTGLWQSWYADGKAESEGLYLNNEHVGEWREWYDNGQIARQGSYERGRKIGTWETYRKDTGALVAQYHHGTYDTPLTPGTWIIQTPSYSRKFLGITAQNGYRVQEFYNNGTQKLSDPFVITNVERVWESTSPISSSGDFFFSQRALNEYQYMTIQSLLVFWHRNGQKALEGSFIQNKQTGLWRYWDERCNKTSETNFDLNGLQQGTSTSWHANDQKQSETNYKDGQKHGTSISWYFDGKPQNIEQYIDGKPEGLHSRWDSSGKLQEQTQYLHGQMNGDQSFWCNSGEHLQSITSYINNLPHGQSYQWYCNSYRYYDRDKPYPLKEQGTWVNGAKQGLWTTWHENGQAQEATYFDNNQKQGEHNTWYENGQAQEATYFDNNQKQGEYNAWYENGPLQENGVYREGRMHGQWTYWHRNGNIRNQLTYRDGCPSGKWTYWYANGQKEAEFTYTKDVKYAVGCAKKIPEKLYWDEEGQPQDRSDGY